MRRCDVRFSGHVQGVGFRYTTRSIAARFAVTGYVENLPDGTVHMVAEGEPPELDALLAEIQQEMAGYIRETSVHYLEPNGEFHSFGIRT